MKGDRRGFARAQSGRGPLRQSASLGKKAESQMTKIRTITTISKKIRNPKFHSLFITPAVWIDVIYSVFHRNFFFPYNVEFLKILGGF